MDCADTRHQARDGGDRLSCGAQRFEDRGRTRVLAALLVSSLWMAAAYTLAGAVLYASLPAALASSPGLLMEGLVNSVLALLLLPMLRERFPKF